MVKSNNKAGAPAGGSHEARYEFNKELRNYWKFVRTGDDPRAMFPPSLIYLPKKLYAEQPLNANITVTVTPRKAAAPPPPRKAPARKPAAAPTEATAEEQK